MSEYVPGSMTDKQALEVLKSMKLTMGRGSAKTLYQQGILEAVCHAITALEEKVGNTSIEKCCATCKYETNPIPAEPCFSCIHGLCDENTNRTEKWEAKE